MRVLMSIERIYFELEKHNSDEYYIELAQNDVLFIPVVIDIMIDDKNSVNLWAESIIEKLSEVNPLVVYPYIGYISKLIGLNDSVNSLSAWRIICNLLVCDYNNFWQNLRDKYYKALNSSCISEFSIACACARKIADAKPDEQKHIEEILRSIDNRSFYLGESVCEQAKKIAKEKAGEVLDSFACNNNK